VSLAASRQDVNALAGFAVGGFQPFSASDWPEHLAAVVFAQGCPLKCGYCHNPHLIPRAPGTIAFEDVLRNLEVRRNLLDGVVFSGGEPCAQHRLPIAIDAVRELGLRVGLHTAGTFPLMLARVLPRLDWVGLDVKAPPRRFTDVTGVSAWRRVEESLDLLARSGCGFEARTTWGPTLFPEHELFDLAQMLAAKGVANYVLQRLRHPVESGGVTRWESGPAPSTAMLDALAAIFPRMTLR
jgi:pyruvate formate lyase activating enzyme